MKTVLSLLLVVFLIGCAKSKPVVEGETFPLPPKKAATQQKAASKPQAKKQSVATQPAEKPAVSKKKPATPKPGAPVETVSSEKFGRIALVNPSARFVILSFPIGEVAEPQQRLNVYRDGLKVGELRVTGPQRENNTVADIVQGEPRIDDEVREN